MRICLCFTWRANKGIDMSNVRRRAVLTAAGAAGLAVAFPAPHIALAEKPQDEGVRDEASLLANIVGRVAGTSETNASAAVQPKLTNLYETAQGNLEDRSEERRVGKGGSGSRPREGLQESEWRRG